MFLPLEFIADAFDGGADFHDITKYDLNHDGVIDGRDCPFVNGSLEAKLWFKNILEAYINQTEIPEDIKAKYGDDVIGMYKGKPLVPGSTGEGQGDFQFLVDKLQVTQGLSYNSAVKIAGKMTFKY